MDALKEDCALPIQHTFSFFLSIAIPLFMGFANSIATFSAVENWYPLLKKPFFNPPKSIFGPAWTVLYICMGYGSFIIYHKRDLAVTRESIISQGRFDTALILYGVQMFINQTFTPILFGVKHLPWALGHLYLMLVTASATMAVFFTIDPLAGSLLVPYILFIVVAIAVVTELVRLNPRANDRDRKKALNLILQQEENISSIAFDKLKHDHPALFEEGGKLSFPKNQSLCKRDMSFLLHAALNELAGRNPMILVNAPIKRVYLEDLTDVAALLKKVDACPVEAVSTALTAFQDAAVALLVSKNLKRYAAELTIYFAVIKGYLDSPMLPAQRKLAVESLVINRANVIDVTFSKLPILYPSLFEQGGYLSSEERQNKCKRDLGYYYDAVLNQMDRRSASYKVDQATSSSSFEVPNPATVLCDLQNLAELLKTNNRCPGDMADALLSAMEMEIISILAPTSPLGAAEASRLFAIIISYLSVTRPTERYANVIGILTSERSLNLQKAFSRIKMARPDIFLAGGLLASDTAQGKCMRDLGLLYDAVVSELSMRNNLPLAYSRSVLVQQVASVMNNLKALNTNFMACFATGLLSLEQEMITSLAGYPLLEDSSDISANIFRIVSTMIAIVDPVPQNESQFETIVSSKTEILNQAYGNLQSLNDEPYQGSVSLEPDQQEGKSKRDLAYYFDIIVIELAFRHRFTFDRSAISNINLNDVAALRSRFQLFRSPQFIICSRNGLMALEQAMFSINRKGFPVISYVIGRIMAVLNGFPSAEMKTLLEHLEKNRNSVISKTMENLKNLEPQFFQPKALLSSEQAIQKSTRDIGFYYDAVCRDFFHRNNLIPSTGVTAPLSVEAIALFQSNPMLKGISPQVIECTKKGLMFMERETVSSVAFSVDGAKEISHHFGRLTSATRSGASNEI